MRKRLIATLVPLFLTLLFVLPLRSAPLSAQASAPIHAPLSPLSAEPQQANVPEVFGGREAQPGAWPWQAALVFASISDAFLGQYCGGTLIAPDWVLTAAHCVDGFEAREMEVVLGRHRLGSDEGERLTIAQIIAHPDFNYDPFSLTVDLDSDLALIRLATRSTQQPVMLYDGEAGREETAYIGATVTGWGLTEQLTYPDALREVVVPLVAPETCIQEYGSLVTENMICAGYPKGNKDSCYGDSGGPLVVHVQVEGEQDVLQADGGWRQIGIVSWGRYCGTAGAPGVYTRVSRFTDWIHACMTGGTSPACTGSDLYEPDDQPEQATVISTTKVIQTHHFHIESDRDWLKFEAKAGGTYRIDVEPLGSLSDPLIWLYDDDGLTALAYDDDGGIGKAAHLQWRASRDAVLFVEIQDGANAKGTKTAYLVAIEQVTPLYLPRIAN
jgi:secreted trypsin-like serine protease